MPPFLPFGYKNVKKKDSKRSPSIHVFLFQVSTKEAVWVSIGVLAFSILLSMPFTVISQLRVMFSDPGAYDNIAFCIEDLPQIGQVIRLN